MSRLRRIEQAGRHFFVTTNLACGVSPLTPRERDLCLEYLDKARSKHGFALFAYVIMPNHAHLLLSSFQSTLPKLMRDWKSESAFAIAKARKRSGAIWQPRYFDFILRRAADFRKEFEYIHNNPVSAALVERPEDWVWSSAGCYLKKASMIVRPDVFDVPSDPNEPLWPVPWK
jgi:REP element-mobilizing transposase RayT